MSARISRSIVRRNRFVVSISVVLRPEDGGGAAVGLGVDPDSGVFARLVLAVDRQQPVAVAQRSLVETPVVGVDVSPVTAEMACQQLGGVHPVALHTLDGSGG